MRIIISGGGTGGHIYPALAVAQEICRRNPSADILYIGTAAGMESKIIPDAGLAFKTIEVTGIDRNSMIKASKSLISFPRSFFQAWDIIKSFKPDAVFGTGGYVSFPVLLAGTFSPCKTYIHEQNALPGLANRNLARRVDCVMLTFAEAAAQMESRRVVLTGLPVRQDILKVNREQAWQKMRLKPGVFTVLVFGAAGGQ
nr:glycosyltransferase [Syntrophomonas palmitatica]